MVPFNEAASSSLVFKLYPSSNNNSRVGDDSEAIYIELSESLPKHKGRARKRRGRELHVRCITNDENVTDNDPKLQQQSSSSSIPKTAASLPSLSAPTANNTSNIKTASELQSDPQRLF
jgi:hypothetical protein